MKALKALVIFMGILVVAGMGLVGYGVVTKLPRGAGKAPAAAAPPAGGTPATPAFGAVPVPVPAGARVEQMAVAGDRVVLRVTGGGGDRLIVLDPASGRVAGSFVLAPEAPGTP
ncbi:MAG: hypothetical protein M0006_11205 [Magnetospirillum sp.]|nr:hypothetical protein [Magnetospirillum sp.]